MAEMAKLAVFSCLEKYLFTLFCFELRKAQKSLCEMQCTQMHLKIKAKIVDLLETLSVKRLISRTIVAFLIERSF